MRINRRTALAGALAVPATAAVTAWALSGRQARGAPEVATSESDGKRIVTSNGLPDHATGDFPNARRLAGDTDGRVCWIS